MIKVISIIKITGQEAIQLYEYLWKANYKNLHNTQNIMVFRLIQLDTFV